MLSDDEIDRLLGTHIPGGSAARDWFLPHELPKGLENVRGVVRAILAAHTAKLLAGVEMPEYKYIDRHDVPKEGMCVYTQDQLQSYAAAVAAQARMKALDEAKQINDEYGDCQSSVSDEIEKLKGKV